MWWDIRIRFRGRQSSFHFSTNTFRLVMRWIQTKTTDYPNGQKYRTRKYRVLNIPMFPVATSISLIIPSFHFSRVRWKLQDILRHCRRYANKRKLSQFPIHMSTSVFARPQNRDQVHHLSLLTDTCVQSAPANTENMNKFSYRCDVHSFHANTLSISTRRLLLHHNAEAERGSVLTHASMDSGYKKEISLSCLLFFSLVDASPYLFFGLQSDIFFFNLQLRKHDDGDGKDEEEEEKLLIVWEINFPGFDFLFDTV